MLNPVLELKQLFLKQSSLFFFFFPLFMFLRKNQLKKLLDYDFLESKCTLCFFTSHFFVMIISLNIYFILDIISMFFFMFYSWSCDVQGTI